MLQNRQRILAEDALKHLLDREQAGARATVETLATTLSIRGNRAAEAFAALQSRELATAQDDAFVLTPAGRQQALGILRRHRLYETWLARNSGLPPEEWHRTADRAEHRIDPETTDSLADRLNNPRFDPHGDPIPTREGDLPALELTALPDWPDDIDALIEHIEDEPEPLFREIGQLAMHPGMVLTRPRHQSDGSIACHAEGRQIVIPAHLAILVQVAAVPEELVPDATLRRLADLVPGDDALIDSLSAACIGAERSRLLDLGLVPGTAIRCEFTGPFGSPRAYFVRGTLVALRREQADRILVRATACLSP